MVAAVPADAQNVTEIWRAVPAGQVPTFSISAPTPGGGVAAAYEDINFSSPSIIELVHFDGNGDQDWEFARSFTGTETRLHVMGVSDEGNVALALFVPQGVELLLWNAEGDLLSDVIVAPATAGANFTSVVPTLSLRQELLRFTPAGEIVVAMQEGGAASPSALFLRFKADGSFKHRVDLVGSFSRYGLARPVDESVTAVSQDQSSGSQRRVEKFDGAGSSIWSFTTPESESVSGTWGNASNARGEVAIVVNVPFGPNLVYVLDPAGAVLWRFEDTFADAAIGAGFTLFLNDDGFVYVGETGRLSGIDPTGSLLWTAGLGQAVGRPIGLDDDGNLVMVSNPSGASASVDSAIVVGTDGQWRAVWTAPVAGPAFEFSNRGSSVGRQGAVFLNGIQVVAGAAGSEPVIVKVSSGATIHSDACLTGIVNSTGAIGRLLAFGSTEVAENDLTLVARDLPSQTFGFVICSQELLPFPILVQGTSARICLSGQVGRLVGPGQIRMSDGFGQLAVRVDLQGLPQPSTTVAAAPGDTWFFQGWYRDTAGAAQTSRTTGAIRVRF